jgi:hypothetical protein
MHGVLILSDCNIVWTWPNDKNMLLLVSFIAQTILWLFRPSSSSSTFITKKLPFWKIAIVQEIIASFWRPTQMRWENILKCTQHSKRAKRRRMKRTRKNIWNDKNISLLSHNTTYIFCARAALRCVERTGDFKTLIFG